MYNLFSDLSNRKWFSRRSPKTNCGITCNVCVASELTKDNVVKLELLGACKSCSMSMMTLKAGIEETIKRAVPQIVSVEAVNLVSEEME